MIENLTDKLHDIEINGEQVITNVLISGLEINLTLIPNWSLGTAVGEQLIKLGLEITGVRFQNNTKIEIDHANSIKLFKSHQCFVTCRERKS